MIVTNKFVVINFPKTGSTFLRQVLIQMSKNQPKRLFKKDLVGFHELELPNARVHNERQGELDLHGLRSQIPSKYSDLPIISIVRNPMERLLSAYNFGFWKKSFPTDKETFLSHYPSFPEISLAQYIESRNLFMTKTYFPNLDVEDKIGFMSVQLIQFFCQDPEKTLDGYLKGEIKVEDILDEIRDIRFLRTENLNEDVYALAKQYFPSLNAEFILDKKKANTSRPDKDAWQKHFNDDLTAYVENKETLYFKLFPEYKIG